MNDEQQQQQTQQAQRSSLNEPQTPGQILKAARQFRGYQQAKVAERLCLSLQTIIDIENDNYTHFAAEIYRRGYMRAYARLCDVDPAIVLRAYEKMGFEEESHSQKPVMLAHDVPVSRHVRRGKRKPLLWVSLGVLLILIVMVVLWWQEQHGYLLDTQKVSLPIKTKTVIDTKSPLQPSKKTSQLKSSKKHSSAQPAQQTQQHIQRTQHTQRIQRTQRAHTDSHTHTHSHARALSDKKYVPDYSITAAH